MAICATCGNDYDKAFTVTWARRQESRRSTASNAPRLNWRRSARTAVAEFSATASRPPEAIFCCAHCARKDSNADVNDRYPVPAGA